MTYQKQLSSALFPFINDTGVMGNPSRDTIPRVGRKAKLIRLSFREQNKSFTLHFFAKTNTNLR